MLKAIIFQKNISENADNEAVSIVLSIEGSLVEITDETFKIKDENGLVEQVKISLFEKDFSTISYLGKFNNDISFRLIKPHGQSLESVIKSQNAIGAFSIGSLSPDGFGIHFILVDPSENRNSNTENLSNRNQLQNFIEVSIISFEWGLEDKFIEFTKRMLEIIKNNPEILMEFNRVDEIIEILMDNKHFFTNSEIAIINQLNEINSR